MLQKVNTTFWLQYNRATNQGDDCMAPCHSLMVVVGGRNSIKYETNPRDYSEAYIYFPPRIMLSEELELYTVLTLLAEIGGYLGLTIGAALLDVVMLLADGFEAHLKKKGAKQ
jgi:hypothetical protein